MITSASNPQIKRIRQLLAKPKARREEGVFVVEGPKMVVEAPEEQLEQVYCSASFAADTRNQSLLAKLAPEIVEDRVFAGVSDTKTPQGILAVVRRPRWTFPDLLTGGPVLILESIQDPGNLGTMLRTGEGAGIGGILANRETVDLCNPKTVRATMGSIYRVPFVTADSLAEAVMRLKEKGYTIFAAHLAGETGYTEARLGGRTAFLIGNEGNGLSEEASALADCLLRIPMDGKVESLNAAIAATLLVYEARRQRSLTGSKEGRFTRTKEN